ncbi:unnamed protein product [Closterium sp. NIES-65]|nr:unnamed protein product [Closterium sp. NIES-65]
MELARRGGPSSCPPEYHHHDCREEGNGQADIQVEEEETTFETSQKEEEDSFISPEQGSKEIDDEAILHLLTEKQRPNSGGFSAVTEQSSYTVISDEGSPDMVPTNAAAALTPSDGSSDLPQETTPLQQQQQQEEEVEEEEEEVPSGEPVPPLGERGEGSVLPPVPPVLPPVPPPVPPHLMNCEAMIKAVTQYERFARGRHGVEEVPWALVREGERGGSMEKHRVLRARGISGGISTRGVEEVPWALVREGERGGFFPEFSQGRKREGAIQAGPAARKEVEEEQREGGGRGRKLGIAARGGMGKEKERRVGRHGGEIEEEGEEDGGRGGVVEGRGGVVEGRGGVVEGREGVVEGRGGVVEGRGGVVEGPYPPWVVGADEENYPLTRRVQRDIWLHQHPENCSLPSVKFLYATFVPQSKYGIGAQLTNVAGALALAVASGRVLVLGKFPRAMHGGCEGRKHGRWHCFFAPETMASGRVLVLGKFPRAMHGGCEGRRHGRWHCFFAPETSDACRRCVCGVVWCGVVWCVVTWCGVVWCVVAWCGVVWCVVAWCGVVWCVVAWCGVVWCVVAWCGVVWCVVAWCGVVWCVVAWCGVVWCVVAWCGVVWCVVAWCGVVWCVVAWCGVVWCVVVCKHGRWHYFFASETSDACRRRAHDLMAEQQLQNPATAEPASNLRAKSNLPVKSDVHSSLPVVRRQDIPEELVWFPPVPSLWGEPWLRIPAVIEINGHMRQTTKTGNKDRWWRAQAWRFLMHSPSRYLCAVINRARHAAFGPMAARHVAHAEAAILQAEKLIFAASTPRVNLSETEVQQSISANAGIFQRNRSQSGGFNGVLVGARSAPWVPRPLVSMHVRMGDKAREMRVAGFGTYLHLLSRVRKFDPSATTVWLSTEMQPVVERAIRTPGWDWKVTNVPRMQGNESMPAFEARIGPQRSVENAWVNLLMAAEADYFIGALGSTWSMLIDGLRCTGGKMLAGFLSTSRDRHW